MSRRVGWAAVVVAAAMVAEARAQGRSEVLFDGSSLDAWVVPEGDGGHWRIAEHGGEKVIDYDARSEATGEKNLVTRKEYGDFTLSLDWRIKEAPYVNKNIAYVLPDGTHARGVDGKALTLALPDSDSGIYLRDRDGKSQVNIWCWPIGSGEVYGYRMDESMPAEVRAGVTPRHQADKPVGEWNHFDITLKGDRLTVVLNGVTVIENAQLPGIPERGPISLQHHGGYDARTGTYTGPPSLVQFKDVVIREL
jgi:hypothetical protein